MRLLALPVLALTLAGFGAEPKPTAETPKQVVLNSVHITQNAGTARFVGSYSGSVYLSGAVNLGNDTAVLDNREIDGEHSIFQPISRREAMALGIAESRWVQTDQHLSFVSDEFIPDTNGFFALLSRADEVRFLGNGEERGTPVRRYSARLGMEAFLEGMPPFPKETFKSVDAGPEPVSWRDFFENYFVWDRGGQRLELAIDSQGRIRRADLELPLEPLSVQLYDYGVSVDVTPPPANQVITSTKYESLKTEYCSNPKRQIQPRKPPCQ